MINTFIDKYLFTNNLKYAHNNFYLGNIPFVFFPTNFLIELVASDKPEISKSIYEMVKKDARDHFFESVGVENVDGRKQLDFFVNFFTGSGWGKISVVDFSKESKRAIIVVDNSPFVEALKGKCTHHVDTFFAGMIAGAMSKIIGEDMDCVEVECAVAGAEHCKFIIKPKTEFDFSNPIVSAQLR
jgi:predicted hydrocarbon binding protein